MNKALHSLHCRKISVDNQAITQQEIVLNVNIILAKMQECDQEKAIVFKPVTEKFLQGVTSQHYEVSAVLKSLERMVEVVDSVEEGMFILVFDNPSKGIQHDTQFVLLMLYHLISHCCSTYNYDCLNLNS